MTTPWPTRIRHSAEYLLAATMSMLVRPLSMETVRSLGEAVGRLAYLLAGSRRRIALDNLARAMPELSAGERERIARGVFEHFARMLLELIRFGRLSREEMLALIEIEGEEHVLRAYAAGKGLIFFSGHLGYWEMQGLANPLRWRPISVMARPLDNERLHEMLERLRTATGNTVIYRQGSIRKVLRALAANGGVAILIDQHLQSPDAVLVDFFGRPAATSSMLAALALRTGAAVVPAFGVPLPGGRYRFEYERPVDPPRDGTPESIRDFTQRCNDRIEGRVREHPDLWLWVHRRWRDTGVAAGAERTSVTQLEEEPRG
jgi:Kdo2-lipid IVA lauroyltransferase/acyltransferase